MLIDTAERILAVLLAFAAGSIASCIMPPTGAGGSAGVEQQTTATQITVQAAPGSDVDVAGSAPAVPPRAPP